MTVGSDWHCCPPDYLVNAGLSESMALLVVFFFVLGPLWGIDFIRSFALEFAFGLALAFAFALAGWALCCRVAPSPTRPALHGWR